MADQRAKKRPKPEAPAGGAAIYAERGLHVDEAEKIVVPGPAQEPVVTGGLREAYWPWGDTRCSHRILAQDKENARYHDEMAQQIIQLREQYEELKKR